WRIQLHEGDARGEDRAAGAAGEGEGVREPAGLARRGRRRRGGGVARDRQEELTAGARPRPGGVAPADAAGVAVDGDGGLAGVRPRPRRGDIFGVALDPTRGTEVRKTR